MAATEMTLNQIREKGREALIRELGPIGYARFIQQFETGKGDYTTERHQWLDSLSLEQIKAMIRDEPASPEPN